MMESYARSPMTLLFRGNLQDAAILVGLVNNRAPIGTIAFTDELNPTSLAYIREINEWLKTKDYPIISIHPNLNQEQLCILIPNPLRDWAWNEAECKVAIRLAGLSEPSR